MRVRSHFPDIAALIRATMSNAGGHGMTLSARAQPADLTYQNAQVWLRSRVSLTAIASMKVGTVRLTAR
jgi:hypothetical protein